SPAGFVALSGDCAWCTLGLQSISRLRHETFRNGRPIDRGSSAVIQRRHGKDHRLGRRRRHCCVRRGLRPVGLEGAAPLMTSKRQKNPALTKENLKQQIACCRRDLSRMGNDAPTESLRAFLADLEDRL